MESAESPFKKNCTDSSSQLKEYVNEGNQK